MALKHQMTATINRLLYCMDHHELSPISVDDLQACVDDARVLLLLETNGIDVSGIEFYEDEFYDKIRQFDNLYGIENNGWLLLVCYLTEIFYQDSECTA